MTMLQAAVNATLCATYSSCFTCLRENGCGWCASDNKCIPGDMWGPLTNLQCSDNWDFMSSQCYSSVSRFQVLAIMVCVALFVFGTFTACAFCTCYRLRKQRLIAQEYVRLFAEYPSYQALNDPAMPYNTRSTSIPHYAQHHTAGVLDGQQAPPHQQYRRAPTPTRRPVPPQHQQRRPRHLEAYASFAGEEVLLKPTSTSSSATPGGPLYSPNIGAHFRASMSPPDNAGVRWNRRRDDLVQKYQRRDESSSSSG
ncbi:Fibroblast growth factor 3 [Sorochytrium milnesiophthora]